VGSRNQAAVIALIIISLFILTAVFGLGYGEGTQYRYYIVTASLSLVLIKSTISLLPLRITRMKLSLIVMVTLLLILSLNPQSTITNIINSDVSPPLPSAVTQYVHALMASDNDASAAMEVHQAYYYGTLNPADSVIVYPLGLVEAGPDIGTQSLLDSYRVTVMTYQGIIDRSIFARYGFTEFNEVEGWTIAIRSNPSTDP
jgi:hypothetical protein